MAVFLMAAWAMPTEPKATSKNEIHHCRRGVSVGQSRHHAHPHLDADLLGKDSREGLEWNKSGCKERDRVADGSWTEVCVLSEAGGHVSVTST